VGRAKQHWDSSSAREVVSAVRNVVDLRKTGRARRQERTGIKRIVQCLLFHVREDLNNPVRPEIDWTVTDRALLCLGERHALWKYLFRGLIVEHCERHVV